MKENTFSMIDDNGVETEFDVLFTFDDESNGKSYIVYTDNSRDEKGNIEVYASIYFPYSSSMRLMPVETEEEWNTIEKILDKLQRELRSSRLYS